MNEDNGTVRFTYFTDKFQETYDFYTDKLDFELEHSWDRNEHDKGALFKAGDGLIEVLQLPNNGEMVNTGLEHRSPQGAFMFIQIGNIDQLFATYKASEIPFKQEVTDQSRGSKSFSIIEPNGLVLFFFQQ